MSLTRVLTTTRTVLTRSYTVDEEPEATVTNPTVEVRRLDGTLVQAASAPALVSGTVATFTFAPPASASVDMWTINWLGTIGGTAVSIRDYVENVGGFLFGLAEMRAKKPTLSADRYPVQDLAAARLEAEMELEDICGQAFVRRFAREPLSGNGTSSVLAPNAGLRAVRAVTVDGAAVTAPVKALADGELVLTDGDTWPVGDGNIMVEYEHGQWYPYTTDYPSEMLRLAVMIRARSLLGITDTSIPYRAQSFSVQDGGVYRLSVASRRQTGIPEVDAQYAKVTLPGGWLA